MESIKNLGNETSNGDKFRVVIIPVDTGVETEPKTDDDYKRDDLYLVYEPSGGMWFKRSIKNEGVFSEALELAYQHIISDINNMRLLSDESIKKTIETKEMAYRLASTTPDFIIGKSVQEVLSDARAIYVWLITE